MPLLGAWFVKRCPVDGNFWIWHEVDGLRKATDSEARTIEAKVHGSAAEREPRS